MFLRQFFAGMDGIFQSVGKDDGKTRRVDREDLWKREVHLQLDLISPGLLGVEGKDSVQQWIASQHSAGTPLTVIYQTATSAESELQKEEIPQIQSVYTHYPNTTISNNNNTYLGVHYLVDTKMYIDRKFAELQQSIVTTQQQLL